MRKFDLPDELYELTEFNQWVVYHYNDDGSLDKTPRRPSGSNASSTNPRTWSTYDACASAHENSERIAGLGFVLTENDPYAVIDLDHCVEEEMANDMADKIVQAIGSYSEFSPSGTGLHIWIKGVLGRGRKRGDVECYDRGRYITITGDRYKGGPIEDRQDELGVFIAQWLPADDAGGQAPQKQTTSTNIANFLAARNQHGHNVQLLTLSDQEILDRCRSSEDGEQFKTLFDRGRLEESDCPSGSEADAYLLGKFCFWTAGNYNRSWDLVRQSGLRHDPRRLKKWARGDYRERTWRLVDDGEYHSEIAPAAPIPDDPSHPAESIVQPDKQVVVSASEAGTTPAQSHDLVYVDDAGQPLYRQTETEAGSRMYVDMSNELVAEEDLVLYRLDDVTRGIQHGARIAIFPDERQAEAFVGHAFGFVPTTVPNLWTENIAASLGDAVSVLLFLQEDLAGLVAESLTKLGVACFWPGTDWGERPAKMLQALLDEHQHEDVVAKIDAIASSAVRLDYSSPLPPLNEEMALPDFPLEVFPDSIRLFAVELADELKWDTGPIGAAMLGVASCAVCDKYVVRISDTWDHPLTLWTWILAQSGSKKTALVNHLSEPLDTVIRAERKEYEIQREAWQIDLEAAEAALDTSKKKSGKSDDRRNEIRDKLEELQAIRDREPVDPDYRGEDVTPESAMTDLVRRQDEHGISKLCFVSSEADAIVNAFTGHYFNGRTNNTVFLKGRDLDRYSRTRQAGTQSVEHVCTSMLLTMIFQNWLDHPGIA